MLSKTVTAPTIIDPSTLLIYGAPKQGKTTICSKLTTDFVKEGDALIISNEVNGAEFNSSVREYVSGPTEFEKTVKEAIKMREEGNGYKFIIYDTITRLDEWSEIVGTYRYMRTSQGKNFNKGLTHDNPKFESVHTLPNGSGYMHSRNTMKIWYDLMIKSAPHVIFIAHLKDKFISSKSGDTVTEREINLTGKVKDTWAAKVDALAYFSRKNKEGFLNFKQGNTSKLTGGRCNHLTDSIKISEYILEEEKVKTFWEEVFINYQNA